MEEKVFGAFKDTTATRKIFQLTKKIRAISGGTSASKTISILVWIIDYGHSTQNKIVTVVGESVPHLNLGAKRDFKNIMVANGYWNDARWSESGVYTFEGGTIVEFISFDKFGKAHGPRRDVLFLNEANYLPYNIADQLITRTRQVVWLDWNPSEEFWFYTEMLGKRELDFMGDGGNYPPLTYRDNEALDQDSIFEIEAHTNPTWRKVYVEGHLGVVEGRIYRNWRPLEEVPDEAKLIRHWLDYGYSNDPTAMGDVYKWNDAYVLDEQLYQKGLLNSQIAEVLLNLEPTPVAADSAEPKSNDELKLRGITIIPAKKGKDSVNSGIQLVQQQKIFVTTRSVNIWKEYNNYLWLEDKDGTKLNVPSPIWNHHMDGIRYAFETLLNHLPERIVKEQEERFYINQNRQILNSTE